METTERSKGADLMHRVRDTLIAPGRLADRVRADAPWLDALLISTLVAILAVAAMPDEVFTASMEDPVTRRGEPVEITSDPSVIARWGRWMGMLAIVGTHPLTVITLAGILTLLFSLIGRGQAGFREYISLASHAMLIPALGTLLALLLRFAGGLVTGTSIAAFYSPDDAPNLFVAALTAIDPFVVWMLIALGAMVHGLEPRHSRAGAASVLVGGYLLLILASTAWLHPGSGDSSATLEVAAPVPLERASAPT